MGVLFHDIVGVLGVVVEIWRLLLFVDVAGILPIFGRQVFAPFEVFLEEAHRLIREVQLCCHRQILLSVQPVTFNVEVNCFFEEVDETRFDLPSDRHEIVVGAKYGLRVDNHSIKGHRVRLILVVVVSDVAPQLVLVKVEVFLL